MKYLCFFSCLIFSSFIKGQVIDFPDANFKAKLLQPNIAYDRFEQSLTIDSNNNGEIEVSEVQDIDRLDISNAGITDLTGISNFSGLKLLNCSNNMLTEITIDSSISLMALWANHNAITSVNVNYSLMEDLDLSFNELTTLSIANANFYESLNLSYNHLANLSLNTVMAQYFIVNNNNLNSIQYNGNITLYRLANFRNNHFSLLRFPGNVYFHNSCDLLVGGNLDDKLYFDGAQPGNISYASANNTSFDLGNFYMTKDCDPEEQGNVSIQNSPNLQQLIFKNGYNHTTLTCNEGGDIFQIPALYLTIANCPNLSQICVDADEQPFFQARITELGLQNQITVDSNCTSSILGMQTQATIEPFTVFPVPVRDVLYLQSNTGIAIRSIEIYNNLGQLIQKELGNKKSLDVSKLAKGSYYLEIKTNDLIDIKRFLKE